ncbi:hypothetical protein [Streptomyces sp. NPDC001508]|uniref:COG4280 domain-containing protein n=1 Tax=Streptomyces sp. NPDC001508 TaxID=3154656 RepID=UPI0033231A7F
MSVGTGAVWALAVAVFLACLVEAVEAVTIVVAMGMTRGWRSAIAGTVVGLASVIAFALVTGYAVVTWLPEAALQLAIGALLLIFGLQWMRKAILRSSGRKDLHDEAEIFEKQSALARQAGERSFLGLDYFAFIVSLKGVFLEGVEVVFIVITFGLRAGDVPVATGAALLATVIVAAAAVVAHGPLTKVPENTLKYGVAVLLSTFGMFWCVEGLGTFQPDRQPLDWPGGTVALGAVLAGWLALSQLLIRVLRVRPTKTVPPALTTGMAPTEDVGP